MPQMMGTYENSLVLGKYQVCRNAIHKITAFVWAYAVIRPGVNALRSPAYPEMINIVNGNSVEFEDYKFEKHVAKNAFENYAFTNGRPITKSMLAWWCY